MNIIQKRAEILERIFNNTRFNQNNNEVFIFCPNRCHKIKRKLCINIEKNVGKCWICPKERGNIFFFLKKYANKNQRKEYIDTLDKKSLNFDIEHEAKDVSLPEGYRFILDAKNDPLGELALDWFKAKKINKTSLIQNKIGICNEGFYKGRIIFPSFSKYGKLNFFVARRVDKNPFQKYLDCQGVSKKSIIFNELLIDWNKPVVLVENVRTPLVHNKIKNIVPILGSDGLSETHKLFQEIHNQAYYILYKSNE